MGAELSRRVYRLALSFMRLLPVSAGSASRCPQGRSKQPRFHKRLLRQELTDAGEDIAQQVGNGDALLLHGVAVTHGDSVHERRSAIA